ncbi:threonine aldolase [Tremella mesenterica]|uniref:Threonine aldolase n=1 Tax=Tremella mesenterica TaxID=5217 RepID=A0A4Q1BDG8_TREME|nr:uncharacterized protein TREMEDRAFT_25705 [Tremella mesenterica DSM 1558]EIW72663.1 hypothetical protein TREMEDRAFT_25705 [Tremella mesenterica DSM 1558]RXK34855.1 threonine aldolase [Tremella mesenterica]
MTVPRQADVTAGVSGQANVDMLTSVSRNFISDTCTIPTDGQMLAALGATRGDDVYQEDESTQALEARIAKLAGKEAALFAMSGTMTNQLSIRAHLTSPPHSVITDYRAHVHKMEAGGIAMFCQATTDTVVPSNGIHITAEDIEPHLQLGNNIHYRPTKLLCLENTLSGMIFPQDEVIKISQLAKKHGLKLHLDGARIWNVAAVELESRGLDARKEEDLQVVLTDLLNPFDSASLCLSKGIGAPIGSAIVGSQEFIERARWFRKAFGGGVRQTGPMAAAADHALTYHFPRLSTTHALARKLAEGLKGLGITIVAPVDTNMVFFDPTSIGLNMTDIINRLESLPQPIRIRGERCVIHHQTSPQAVEEFIDTVARMKSESSVEVVVQNVNLSRKVGEKQVKKDYRLPY